MQEITTAVIANELDIFWQELETEKKLQRYIAEGKSILCDYAGADLVFEEGTFEGRMLIDYVTYAYYKKTEYFEENYQADILKLRLKYQRKAADEDGED